MDTTTIDYDQLNEGAQLLYDTAYAKGHQEGRDEHLHESAEWQARGALDLAEKMLRTASEMPLGEGDEAARFLTYYARLLLSRSPETYVRRPLAMLKTERWLPGSAVPHRLPIQSAADACKGQLGQLGGYPGPY